MAASDSFQWAGEQLGRVLRSLVDALAWFFGHILSALGGFYDGLAIELGIGHSTVGLIGLVIGLLLLISGLRRLLRARLISAFILGGLGVLLLSGLIH